MGGQKPTVGLALGAGAAKGIAHIGVLQSLKEADVNIDYLAGTSIGSMIGGFYAAGLDLKWLERIAYQINWDLLTDLTVPRRGLIAGDKVKNFVQLLTKSKTFSDLEIPFAAVATDIEQGEEVILQEGLVADAIRASTSIPGVYVPYQINDRLLVDGAILNRTPVNVVRDLGADITIAVDMNFDFQKNRVNNIFDVILTSIRIMEREVFDKRTVEADVVIRPEVGHIAPQDLERAEECVAAGVEAARREAPRIKEAIERWED